MPAAVSASAGEGEVVTVDVQVRDDCTKDVTTRTRVAKPRSTYWTAGGVTETVNEALYDNASSPYSPGPGAQGKFYSARAAINGWGTVGKMNR